MSDYADSIGQGMGQGIDLILGLWTRNLMNFGRHTSRMKYVFRGEEPLPSEHGMNGQKQHAWRCW